MRYVDYFSPRGYMISYVKSNVTGSSRKGWREYANPDGIILSSDVVGGFLGELPFDKSLERSVYGYVHLGSYGDDGNPLVVVPVEGVNYHGEFLNWTFQIIFAPPESIANRCRMWVREGVVAEFEIVHYEVQPMIEGAVLKLPPP